MNDKFLYDIILDGKCIINSGDFDFNTETEAQIDAKDYIINELSKEYDRKIDDFKILIYKAFC